MRGSGIVEGSLPRENAVIVVLCREWELDNITETIKTLERQFNHRSNAGRDEQYGGAKSAPWVLIVLSPYVQAQLGILYRQKIMQKYEYYWWVESDVNYYCDMYDPFKTLCETGSVYGWVISIPEFMQAIPTLYSTILRFMEEHPQFIHPKSIFNKFMLTDQQGDADMCNGCHFLFNFEIGSLNFWRSEAYMTFFDYLDKASGFYYERWGDAPVHSIALALVTEESQLHFFLTSLATIMR
ncbi:hypothetical protein MVEG_02200 [Podila verticillata NRRL 6337]|nr:hypothetical protein MVEG_02200 [Podila verticillata NRRL 6337]